MRYVLALLVLMFALPALSAETSSMLSWEPPTERVDGTPLAPEEIGAFHVYYTIGSDVTKDGTLIVLEPFQTAEEVKINLTPRALPYTVYFAITTVDKDGLESELSETVSKTFVVKSKTNPLAPTSLKFTISCGTGCTIEDPVVE